MGFTSVLLHIPWPENFLKWIHWGATVGLISCFFLSRITVIHCLIAKCLENHFISCISSAFIFVCFCFGCYRWEGKSSPYNSILAIQLFLGRGSRKNPEIIHHQHFSSNIYDGGWVIISRPFLYIYSFCFSDLKKWMRRQTLILQMIPSPEEDFHWEIRFVVWNASQSFVLAESADPNVYTG